MDSIKNSANFELCFIWFYEQYAWVTTAPILEENMYCTSNSKAVGTLSPGVVVMIMMVTTKTTMKPLHLTNEEGGEEETEEKTTQVRRQLHNSFLESIQVYCWWLFKCSSFLAHFK